MELEEWADEIRWDVDASNAKELIDEVKRLQMHNKIMHYPDGTTKEVIGYVYDLAEDGTPMWHQVEDEDIYWAWSPWPKREVKP